MRLIRVLSLHSLRKIVVPQINYVPKGEHYLNTSVVFLGMTVSIMGSFACDSWIEILSVSLVDQLSRLALEYAVPLVQERLSEKMCTRQSRKVLFSTLQPSNLLLLLSISTRKHTSIASRTILSNFFEDSELKTTYNTFRGQSRALIPDTPSSKQLYTHNSTFCAR